MDTEHTEIKELVLFKRLDAKAPSGAKLLELGATGYEPKSLLLDGCATKVDFGVTQTLHAVEGRSPSPLDMPPWGRAHRGGDFPPTLSFGGKGLCLLQCSGASGPWSARCDSPCWGLGAPAGRSCCRAC